MFNLSIPVKKMPEEIDCVVLSPYQTDRHAQTAGDMLRCLGIVSFPFGNRLFLPLDDGQRKRLSDFSYRWEILLDQANIELSRM